MKNFGPGLQDTDVIRENNLLKKVVNACRTYLMTLQLLEAVGKDIEVIFPRQIFQYLIRMRHQPTFCGNDRKEIIRKSLGQSSIPRPYCLQRIQKTLAVQLFLTDLPSAVFFPQLYITMLIKRIEMLERTKETAIIILVIHLFECIACIKRKCPKRIVQVKKQVLILGCHNLKERDI